jgi:histidine triad (HIT) family protein
MTEEKNIFEKIIDREVPAAIIYEDDQVISFLNAFPFDDGHVLVIPKKVYKTIFDMPEDEYLYLQKIILKNAKNIREKTGKDIAIYQRNG